MTQSTESFEYIFKFLIISSASTGKSSILRRFLDNIFKEDSSHTIGAEFGSKTLQIKGKNVKIQVWDTAGQERFRSVTRSYYRGASGALLVYDIAERESFNAVADWLADVRTLASPNIVIILCGNKLDLDAEREVSYEEGNQFAQENNLLFVETSAKINENITESFDQCAHSILGKIESGTINPNRMYSGIQYNRIIAAHQNENLANNIIPRSSRSCSLCQT